MEVVAQVLLLQWLEVHLVELLGSFLTLYNAPFRDFFGG